MFNRRACAWFLALASLGTFAHGATQLGGAGTLPAASHAVRIVTFGDSTTATARDWAPEIKEVYSDCLPAALARQDIRAVVTNAGIGDTTGRRQLFLPLTTFILAGLEPSSLVHHHAV